MIELPGWISGIRISPIPHRGPEPSSRILLAMQERLTATVFRAPEARPRRRMGHGLEGFAAGRSGRPVSSRKLRRHTGGELGVGVDSRAHRRTADGQLRQQSSSACSSAPDAMLDLAGKTRELLAKPDRHGILQVGPADLDDRSRARRLLASLA